MSSRSRRILALIMGVSAGLRVLIVLRGGQFFWPDELRYNLSLYLSSTLFRDGIGAALANISYSGQQLQHNGFTFLSFPPLALQSLLKVLTGTPLAKSVWVPGLYFSLASVLCIGLIFAVARRAGASERESLYASFLLACSSCMFYLSRHLLPYDSSMAILLFAAWLVLREKDGDWRRSFLCGFVISLGYLTYNGFWTLAFLLLVLETFRRPVNVRGVLTRGIAAASAFLLIPVILTVIGWLKDGSPYLVWVATHKGVNQGDFREGWSLPWGYLWHAEHLLYVLWMAAAAYFLVGLRQEDPVTRRRGILWVVSVAGIYAFLAICSTGVQAFVVYGRLVRQLVPGLCLVTALVAESLSRRSPAMHRIVIAVGLAILVQAALNFAPVMKIRYPNDMQVRQDPDGGPLQYLSSVDTTKPEDPPARSPASVVHRFLLVNCQNTFYPPRASMEIPHGKIVWEVPHPLSYVPYQYEGYDPAQRAILQSTDISIRLVDTGSR